MRGTGRGVPSTASKVSIAVTTVVFPIHNEEKREPIRREDGSYQPGACWDGGGHPDYGTQCFLVTRGLPRALVSLLHRQQTRSAPVRLCAAHSASQCDSTLQQHPTANQSLTSRALDGLSQLML